MRWSLGAEVALKHCDVLPKRGTWRSAIDIDVLLWLQGFREGAGAFLTGFFLKVTHFGELSTVLAIMAAVYWCVSKDFGSYLLMGWNLNRILNGAIKITACVYRPWIRDSRIVPDPTAIASATGYSFPSGHSMNGASLFGGIAVRKDMLKGLRIAAWVVVLLIPFSRIFLTVHTPQDVLIGTAVGCLVMWGSYRLIPTIEQRKNADIAIAAISVLLSIALAVYASAKSYPIDYDSSGAVLADGAKMANDTFKGIGWNLAFFIGWVVERRFVGLSSDGTIEQRCFRLIGGLLGYYIVGLIICPMVKFGIRGGIGTLSSCFLEMIYIVLVLPCIIKAVQRRSTQS